MTDSINYNDIVGGAGSAAPPKHSSQGKKNISTNAKKIVKEHKASKAKKIMEHSMELHELGNVVKKATSKKSSTSTKPKRKASSKKSSTKKASSKKASSFKLITTSTLSKSAICFKLVALNQFTFWYVSINSTNPFSFEITDILIC